jgi:hypothetical protein
MAEVLPPALIGWKVKVSSMSRLGLLLQVCSKMAHDQPAGGVPLMGKMAEVLHQPSLAGGSRWAACYVQMFGKMAHDWFAWL